MGRELGEPHGPARRCGWFDAVATPARDRGEWHDELAVTNVDGLDSVEVSGCASVIRACSLITYDDIELLAKSEPVYSIFRLESNSTTRQGWKDLPANPSLLGGLAELTGPNGHCVGRHSTRPFLCE